MLMDFDERESQLSLHANAPLTVLEVPCPSLPLPLVPQLDHGQAVVLIRLRLGGSWLGAVAGSQGPPPPSLPPSLSGEVDKMSELVGRLLRELPPEERNTKGVKKAKLEERVAKLV